MRCLLALLLVGCGANTDVHQLATQGVLGTPAPATFAANVLYAQASVDGVGGGSLLVDTGAPLTVLSPARWPGASLPAGSGLVDRITVGGLTVEQVPALTVDLFGDKPGFLPGGILGANVACQFATVLDYRGAEVRLAAGPPTDVTGAALPGTAVPIHLEGGGDGTLGGRPFQYGPTRVPLTVTVDGTARTLILDSGASYLVLRGAEWSALAADGRPTLDGVPILSASGPISGRLTRARTVTLGGEAVADAPVLDIGDELLDSFAAEVGHPVDGLLGGAYLREFLVTIDFPHGALYLARYDGRDHIDPDEFHQVGVALDVATSGGHRFAVSHVFAGTDAAKQGLTDGTALVSVDGAPLDGLGLDAAQKLLHGPVGTVKAIATASATLQVKVDDLLPPP